MPMQLFSVSSLQPRLVNHQTGTDYTVLLGDKAKLIALDNTDPVAVTLPLLALGWYVAFENIGAGVTTITVSGALIDGQGSIVLHQGQGIDVYCDGVNYYTQRGMGAGIYDLQNGLHIDGNVGKLGGTITEATNIISNTGDRIYFESFDGANQDAWTYLDNGYFQSVAKDTSVGGDMEISLDGSSAINLSAKKTVSGDAYRMLMDLDPSNGVIQFYSDVNLSSPIGNISIRYHNTIFGFSDGLMSNLISDTGGQEAYVQVITESGRAFFNINADGLGYIRGDSSTGIIEIHSPDLVANYTGAGVTPNEIVGRDNATGKFAPFPQYFYVTGNAMKVSNIAADVYRALGLGGGGLGANSSTSSGAVIWYLLDRDVTLLEYGMIVNSAFTSTKTAHFIVSDDTPAVLHETDFVAADGVKWVRTGLSINIDAGVAIGAIFHYQDGDGDANNDIVDGLQGYYFKFKIR